MHLAVLFAFAVAQPLLELLGKNAEFFSARGSSPREIVVFTVVLVLVPPALLLLAELGAGLASRRLGWSLHLLFLGALTALLALQLTKRLGLPASGALAAAAGLGIVAALAYARARALRTLLTALAPVPAVFAGLFLFATPVSRLVLTEDVELQSAAVRGDTPVVLVVFDELSTVSLLDRRERIDSARYPNFAALADDALWFRDATTVHAHTEIAVPAILTGRLPRERRLPVHSDHPRNLFALVGESYRLNVLETLTRLCPPELCEPGGATGPARLPSGRRAEVLASDATIVYLHLLLPESLARRVPPLTDTWTDFRGRPGGEPADQAGCGREVCRFTARIGPSREPSLHFLHSLLPHVPWQYLPSGRRYATDDRRIPGVEGERWGDDEWLTRQGYQRYLLQLGYTDLALGLILERLRAAGLYERALVIVTADHGVAFTPGEPRRLVTRRNLHELAFVPLLVKLPGQQPGRVVEGLARSIDVLPTIVDALGIDAGWELDGRSLLAGALPREGDVAVGRNVGQPVRGRLSELLELRRAAHGRQLEDFGDGPFDAVYRFGPANELVGARMSELDVSESTARVEVDREGLFRSVDPDVDPVPAYLTGTLPGGVAGGVLAVALNGEVVAVTRTYRSGERVRFGAILPPASLRSGTNAIAVLAATTAGGVRSLERLRSDETTYELRPGAVASSAGRTFALEPGALEGAVRAGVRPESVRFTGWAVDPRERAAADLVVVFAAGSSVYAGSASTFARRDTASRFGVPRAGFSFELPRSLLGDDLAAVRVFALRGGVAVELPLSR